MSIRRKKNVPAPDPSPFNADLPASVLESFYGRYLGALRGSALAQSVPEEVKPPAVDTAHLERLKACEPYRVTQAVPDMMEVITAWRAWDVRITSDGPRLEALGQSVIWKPREILSAVCVKSANAYAQLFSFPLAPEQPGHRAPHMACDCGVWAFKDLDRLVAAVGNKYKRVRVLGNAQLWGRVIETENGYRAEKAYPSELWILDESLEELGLIYDVPVRMIRN